MTCEFRIEEPETDVSVEFGCLDELDCQMRIGDLTVSARWVTFEALYQQLRPYFVPEEDAKDPQ